MTSLIACIGDEKGTLAHIDAIIKKEDWDSIFLVTDEKNKDSFKPKKEVNYIIIDQKRFLSNMTEDIKKQLEGKIKDLEVAVNIISGSGKQHMATISAIMKIGLGIRLIALTPDGIKEI